MKTIIILLLVITSNLTSQDVTIKISSNKSEYKKNYSSGENMDPILVNYTLYNNTSDSILIKFEPYFELIYAGDGYEGYSQCFRMEPVTINGEQVKRYYSYNEYSSFVKIAPNDSLLYRGEFDIFWPCRGAPPSGNWEFMIKYSRELTEEDNYFLFNSRYTDLNSKEFRKAWEGKLSSNSINIKILRN